jgi:hypothetical protein
MVGVEKLRGRKIRSGVHRDALAAKKKDVVRPARPLLFRNHLRAKIEILGHHAANRLPHPPPLRIHLVADRAAHRLQEIFEVVGQRRVSRPGRSLIARGIVGEAGGAHAVVGGVELELGVVAGSSLDNLSPAIPPNDCRGSCTSTPG